MLAKSSVKLGYTVGLSLWVVGIFLLSQLLIGLLVGSYAELSGQRALLTSVAGTTMLSVLVYGLTVGLLLGSGKLVSAFKASKDIVGLSRLVSWSDIGIGILGVLPYFLLSAAVAALAMYLMGGSELNHNQALPFDTLSSRLEMVLAFFTLVVVAPFVEELVFRGYFYGKLRQKLPAVATVVITAVVFGLLHLPGAITKQGVDLQTAAALDTMALGLIMGSLRALTGSIWAGVVLHMCKNAIAFFFLFIYPSIGGTL